MIAKPRNMHEALGWFPSESSLILFSPNELDEAAESFRQPAFMIIDPKSGRLGVGFGGRPGPAGKGGYPCFGLLPGLYPEWLGDRAFNAAHGVRFPYVGGEMARGISGVAMVVALGRAGMMGFYGAGGMPPNQVEEAIVQIQKELGQNGPYGCNLIHSPVVPGLEDTLVDIFLEKGVRRVCASAYIRLTPPVVRYAFSGIHTDSNGKIIRPNALFAKISRPEVARHFIAPPPEAILKALVAKGQLSAGEAELASREPLAQDVTVEADSGGHTDNQVLSAAFPVIDRLRKEICDKYGYLGRVRLGAAGGLGTPAGLAGAFALGAAYVVTGTVNQSAIEAGISQEAKAMLANAGVSDVTMCPSADMFEMGVKVQVLKKGTMFAGRASQLYELYVRYPSLEAIPQETRDKLEKQVFRKPLEEVWEETRAFFEVVAPSAIERAQNDPKHKMALVFRWYLGQSSRWPIVGEKDRAMDYQIWCGAAMGAFNDWVKGTFLEPLENRSVVQIALNLLEGAAKITRAHQLRSYGVPVPHQAFDFRPRHLV